MTEPRDALARALHATGCDEQPAGHAMEEHVPYDTDPFEETDAILAALVSEGWTLVGQQRLTALEVVEAQANGLRIVIRLNRDRLTVGDIEKMLVKPDEADLNMRRESVASERERIAREAYDRGFSDGVKSVRPE